MNPQSSGDSLHPAEAEGNESCLSDECPFGCGEQTDRAPGEPCTGCVMPEFYYERSKA